ncbi:MAG: ferritin [Candidatus Omnitrophica bacterium]|nr:ferritin [Candidatus Omnitrophota bacterium]
MIGKKVLDALNRQINREIYSAYFYLGMAAYADSIGMKGIASWFRMQWKEELFHADKMFNYINDRGNRVMLGAIEEPPQDFSSVRDLFERTYEHEKKVTKLIHNLVDLAKSEKDTESESFLQWFVNEQREEEATPRGILERVKKSEKDVKAMSQIDGELAKRK